eukprot:PITA_24681
MHFDGAVGNNGAGIGIWVRSPFSTSNKVPSKVRVCSYKLAFDCSNNEAEYEALIVGLKILRKLNSKRISVYGDSELVIKQHHPTISDNQRYWQVFQDDEEIDDFMKNKGKFKETSIDAENDDGKGNGTDEVQINEMDVLQLKNNVIPKGLIPLEELFDQDDVACKPTLQPTEKGVEEVNIGTTANPKLHTIPINPNQKPFIQKLRRLNPKLLPSIKKEINRLYKSGIIVLIRFSDWISNLVPVRKKIGEIRLCIDFRNLNKVSLKDNYPLPKMDHILQRVVGASRMSLLDGYSGYNQVYVHEDD